MEELIVANSSDLVLQAGFAGFAILLLAILFWLIKQLLRLQKDTNQIINEHNKQAVLIHETQNSIVQTLTKLYEKLISRPCIQEKE